MSHFPLPIRRATLAAVLLCLTSCNRPAPVAKKVAEEPDSLPVSTKGFDLPSFSTVNKVELERTEYPEGGVMTECFIRRDADGNSVKHGKETTYYRNPRKLAESPKQSEGEYSNGKKNGRWIEWDEKGMPIYEGTWRDGKKDGRWVTWNREQKTQVEEEFRDDQLRSLRIYTQDPSGAFNVRNGDWAEYYADKKPKSIEHYVDNVEDGEWISWHEPDPKSPTQLKSEVRNYKNGKPDGTWLTTYASGARKSKREFRDGKPHGKVESWYEDGRKEEEGEYESGLKHGIWTTWLPNGQKTKQVEYVAGKAEGIANEWYLGEQVWITGRYIDGQKDGEWIEFYKAGKDDVPQKRSLERIKAGRRDGVSEFWFKNGKLERHEEYAEGRPVGTWTAWYDNGQQMTETHWVDGLPHGTHKRWSAEGRLLAEQVYEKGVLVKIVHSEPLKLDPKQPGKLKPATELPEDIESAGVPPKLELEKKKEK